jgi:enoyl-CoA hydratase/carnithine racemase
MPGPVHLERLSQIAILRLERPEVRNAIDSATLKGLEDCLATVDQEPEIAVLILTGAGTRTFCAGSDLGEFASLKDHQQGLHLVQRMEGVLSRLEDGPQVVIAALNGSALGGGCELLTACHLRLAAETAQFSFRQAAMGVTTGWGGGRRLFRQVGRAAALRLLLTADTLDAQEALRLGLVDFLAPAEQLMNEAVALAQRIADNSHQALRGFLELANAIDRLPAGEIPALERSLFEQCFAGERLWRKVAQWQNQRQGQNETD